MTESEYKLAEITLKVDRMLDLVQRQNTKNPAELPEWVDLATAVKYKGGGAYETYRTRYWLQPCAGTHSERIAGRKSWRKSDVIIWASIPDSDIEKYASQFGVKIPKRN